MKKTTQEWIKKAEGDYHSAKRELHALKHPNYDSACFHAQQSAEKYLKAFLQEFGIRFERTHNLMALLDLVLPRVPEWELFRPDLRELTQYAIAFRYPGQSADRPLARDAVQQCDKIREAVRLQLRLPKSIKGQRLTKKKHSTRNHRER